MQLAVDAAPLRRLCDVHLELARGEAPIELYACSSLSSYKECGCCMPIGEVFIRSKSLYSSLRGKLCGTGCRFLGRLCGNARLFQLCKRRRSGRIPRGWP
jgi:hypothetical protein